MWKQLLIIEVLILILISCDESSTTTSERPLTNILDTVEKNSVNCSSIIFEHSNNSILDILNCENMSSDVLQSLSDFLNQAPDYFIVMIGMDVMDESFESWIKNDFTENLSRPIVLKIYSNSEDIEKIFILDKSSSKATLQYAMDFLNKVMTTDYFYEDNPEILKDAIKNNCTICIRLAYLIDERFRTNFTITDDEMDALSCDAACFKALLDLPYNFNFNESSDQIYKSIFHSFIDKIRQSLGTAVHISQNYTVGDYLRDFETKFPLFWITALAWKEAEYQIFEFLIRNDFPFPANFLQSRKIEERELPVGHV
ncbi:unnamed protein product [Chironomus riparius]|uniref:Uncharacterized protein n=1 Tax=Chironomus riparius TaxID=315576 RepID=A0A9N9S9T1_9DIPT|nr:unnamed protein product [Chironomus riparius]